MRNSFLLLFVLIAGSVFSSNAFAQKPSQSSPITSLPAETRQAILYDALTSLMAAQDRIHSKDDTYSPLLGKIQEAGFKLQPEMLIRVTPASGGWKFGYHAAVWYQPLGGSQHCRVSVGTSGPAGTAYNGQILCTKL